MRKLMLSAAFAVLAVFGGAAVFESTLSVGVEDVSGEVSVAVHVDDVTQEGGPTSEDATVTGGPGQDYTATGDLEIGTVEDPHIDVLALVNVATQSIDHALVYSVLAGQ